MSPETAELIVLVGAVAGVVVSVSNAAAAGRRWLSVRRRSFPFVEVEVEQDSGGFERMLASTLSVVPIGVRVETAEAGRVEFRIPYETGLLPFVRGLVGRIEVREEGGGRVRLRGSTDVRGVRRSAVIAMAVSLAIGLPVVAVITWLLLAFVVHSPEPGIRWQALQVLQIVHVLWPPWLLLWIGRRNQRVVEGLLAQAVERVRFQSR